MIELSPRTKNFIFWISTALISSTIFGVFVIDIFVTDVKGKDKLSIILSYLSTVFAFLSALALFATIGVYFVQKNDQIKRDENIIDKKKKAIEHLLKKGISDFEYNINKLIFHLNSGNVKNAMNQLKEINTKFIEKCLIDSKDIDFSMFYSISDLLDSVIDNKDIIEKRINNGSNENKEYREGTRQVCTAAKKEVESILKTIAFY